MSIESVIDWLLEPENPSARYLTLRHLIGRGSDDAESIIARQSIPDSLPARQILDAQYPAGHWIKPDRGYSPKYRATIWQLIFLADLGMPCTPAVARACELVLQKALHKGYTLFSAHEHSTGIYPCLNGNLLRALVHFGYQEHLTVQAVARSLADWVRTMGFACPRNATEIRKKGTWRPCVCGCVKVLRALAALPHIQQTWAVCRAAEMGIDFLRACTLAQDQRPMLAGADSSWLQLGFPLGDRSDLLEASLALSEWGESKGSGAITPLVMDKRGHHGRWSLEFTLSKTWADWGHIGQPNKWVTVRVLQVIEPA
jgi:hypothetical protein